MAAEYHVVPFIASIGITEGSKEAAAQLQAMIRHYSAQGLEYVRLESVTTYVAGDSGCFGIGDRASRVTSYSMVVFKR